MDMEQYIHSKRLMDLISAFQQQRSDIKKSVSQEFDVLKRSGKYDKLKEDILEYVDLKFDAQIAILQNEFKSI